MAHSEFYRRSKEALIPTDQQRQRSLHDVELAYRGTSWDLPSDFDSRRAFEDALPRLQMKSSPGLPYCFVAPTNGDWLGFDGVNFNPHRVEELWWDVQRVMRGEFDSYWRVFIKWEPHKRTKALSKRWRLILSPALPVQMLWQMLFRFQNDLEIAQAYSIPSQQGFIPYGGGWRDFRSQWLAKSLNYGTDMTAWDWTVPGWLLRDSLEFRKRMCRGSPEARERAFALMDSLYSDAFEHPRLVLSDGRVFRQLYWGVMKSGCLNTISDNGHAGALLHCHYCYDYGIPVAPFPAICGDDKIQTAAQVADCSIYEKYGLVVKSISEDLEFMGHQFDSDGPKPMYVLKHVYNLLHVDPQYLEETLESYMRLYAHSPFFTMWERIARNLGIAHRFLSRSAYLFWYDYPCASSMGVLSHRNWAPSLENN